MASVLKLSENTTQYTALRASANDLLKYVSFATAKDISDVRQILSNYTSETTSENAIERTRKFLSGQETLNINEVFLSDVEPVPLYAEMQRLNPPFRYSTPYNPFSKIRDTTLKSNLQNKIISLVYHDATKASNNDSVLTDISALFCSIIPTTELSLCVPYFDVKILYPWTENSDYPRLDLLKFVGFNTKSALGKAQSDYVNPKYGYDVVGMEIFTVPQTLAAPTDSFKSPEAYNQRGVDVLDPITPLMSINSVDIQQIGVGGGLNVQSKITMNLTLHDRSRLGDIEPLVSASIFPFITFRVSFGWAHPDTNKMSNNVYANFLNNMRITQDYALSSVSITSRSTASLNITLTLVGTGTQISKSAKIVSASSKYVPYGAVDSLVRQFITLKTRSPSKSKSDDNSASFERVGSSVITNLSASTTRNKFVNVEAYYQLYNRLKSGIKNDDDLNTITDILTKLVNDPTKEDIEKDVINEFNEIFRFEEANSNTYGLFTDSVLNSLPQGSRFIPAALKEFVVKTAIESGFKPSQNISQDTSTSVASLPNLTPEQLLKAQELDAEFQRQRDIQVGFIRNAAIVPVAEMISHIVAKPLLVAQPDIDEVRIHCFSFNSACGRFAEESIGNFPIIKSKFLNYLEEKEKDKKISSNTSVDSALTLILQQINDPSSPFYGFSSNFEKAKNRAQEIRNSFSGPSGATPEALSEEQAKQLQIELENVYKSEQTEIDNMNAAYLAAKGITGVDTAFVPPKIKVALEVLPAYEKQEDRLTPTKKIARIIIYDERCGGFNKLGNLLFSMINSNGIARVNKDGASSSVDLTGVTTVDRVNSLLKTVREESQKSPEDVIMLSLGNKKAVREVASNLYPVLTIGSEGTAIKNASYSSAPSGEIQSSYLLTALKEQGGAPTGASSESALIDDVFIIPSSVNLSMLGNTCITRGQTYYVDFNTGTTLDNSYTVTSVSHTLQPGSFTTNAILAPTNSASIKTTQRQVQELVVKIKNTYNPTPKT